MSDRPLVSVVIPTYNNAALASEAVESVLAQSYKPVEIFVVDDGSTDETRSALERYAKRVNLILQEHKGPGAARNQGILHSTGEYIAFLDSDDIWYPRKLEVCIAALEQEHAYGAVYHDYLIVDTERHKRYAIPHYEISGWIARDLFVENLGFHTSTVVARRSCFDRIGLFDEELIRAQDWDMWLRVAEEYPVLYVGELLAERRLHPGGLSVVKQDLYAEYNLRTIHKAAERRPDLYAEVEKGSLSNAHFRFGLDQYRFFRKREARREFTRSLRLRWNARALDYYLRSLLPTALIKTLRAYKERREEGHWEDA